MSIIYTHSTNIGFRPKHTDKIYNTRDVLYWSPTIHIFRKCFRHTDEIEVCCKTNQPLCCLQIECNCKTNRESQFLTSFMEEKTPHNEIIDIYVQYKNARWWLRSYVFAISVLSLLQNFARRRYCMYPKNTGLSECWMGHRIDKQVPKQLPGPAPLFNVKSKVNI